MSPSILRYLLYFIFLSLIQEVTDIWVFNRSETDRGYKYSPLIGVWPGWGRNLLQLG